MRITFYDDHNGTVTKFFQNLKDSFLNNDGSINVNTVNNNRPTVTIV